MKIITFVTIKISDSLWDMELVNSTPSLVFVRTKTLKPREAEWFINVTQLLVLEVAIECSDSGSQLSIFSTAPITEHLNKWLEMSYYSSLSLTLPCKFLNLDPYSMYVMHNENKIL